MPCPSYAEFLGGLIGPGAAKSYLVRYYYLNCGTVHAIPAHGSVTYQIKLPLPPGLPVGFYSKLDWQIQGGTGPAVATSLTVEPRAQPGARASPHTGEGLVRTPAGHARQAAA